MENATVLLVEPVAFAAGMAVVRVPVRVIRPRRRGLLAALAVASAVGALAAGGTATGWAPFDGLLRAALAAVLVYAGARASLATMLVASIIASAAGIGDALALAFGLGALGFALASILGADEPVLGGAAGGLLVQAALRLTHPIGDGLTAAVAAAVLVPVLVSAVRTLRPERRRPLVRLAACTAGFAVAGCLVGALAAGNAVAPLRRGLAVASQAVGGTTPAAPGRTLEATAAGLRDAGRDFASAQSALDAWWSLPARLVPVVGQHLKVLSTAADSGRDLASAGERTLGAPALTDVRIAAGKVPLDQLSAIERPAAELAARATSARRRLSDARSAFLVPPLARELDEHLGRLRDVERTVHLANRVLQLVPSLFGGEQPRRYFLAVQQPAEARAGGGFLGNFGEITAANGQLSLARIGRQEDLVAGPGSPPRRIEQSPEYRERYARFRPEQSWANVNLSPDFPTDARVIAELYPQSGGKPVDGVIAVDPAALAAVLAVSGPVTVPSWPVPITPDNVLQVLLYEQYQRFDGRGPRSEFLGEVAEAAWKAMTRGDLPPLPQLLAAFGPVAAEKHVLFWSAVAEEQRLFEDMGVAGRVAPAAPNRDFVALVTQNATGNKIDYFLRRELDYQVRLEAPGGDLRATARITLHNEAPASGVGDALIANDLNPPLPPGSNKLYLSFYSPWALGRGTVDGVAVDFEKATELGRNVYSTALVIPPRSTVVLELELAGRLAGLDGAGDRYVLDLHRQPTVAPDDVTASVTVEGPWLAVGGAEEHRFRTELESDAQFAAVLGRP